MKRSKIQDQQMKQKQRLHKWLLWLEGNGEDLSSMTGLIGCLLYVEE